MFSQTTRLYSAYSNISHRKLNWIDTDCWSWKQLETLHNHLFAQKPYSIKYLVEKVSCTFINKHTRLNKP